jgi:hypothetical protein
MLIYFCLILSKSNIAQTLADLFITHGNFCIGTLIKARLKFFRKYIFSLQNLIDLKKL